MITRALQWGKMNSEGEIQSDVLNIGNRREHPGYMYSGESNKSIFHTTQNRGPMLLTTKQTE